MWRHPVLWFAVWGPHMFELGMCVCVCCVGTVELCTAALDACKCVCCVEPIRKFCVGWRWIVHQLVWVSDESFWCVLANLSLCWIHRHGVYQAEDTELGINLSSVGKKEESAIPRESNLGYKNIFSLSLFAVSGAYLLLVTLFMLSAAIRRHRQPNKRHWQQIDTMY